MKRELKRSKDEQKSVCSQLTGVSQLLGMLCGFRGVGGWGRGGAILCNNLAIQYIINSMKLQHTVKFVADHVNFNSILVVLLFLRVPFWLCYSSTLPQSSILVVLLFLRVSLCGTVAKVIIDYGIGLSYRPASLSLPDRPIRPGRRYELPSNAHIFRHPFFRKQCFSLKYVLVAPLKIFGGMSKFGIYVKMKSSLQF